MRILPYILALNLLIANAFPNQNLGELLKVFPLLGHWHHHQNEVSFLDYLALHYTDEQHHEQDHEHHEDLPFHSHDQGQNSHDFVKYPSLSMLYEQKHCFLEHIKQFFAYHCQLSHSFIADIWQPPKF